MMAMRIAVIAGILVVTTSARADTATERAHQATKLFEEGRELAAHASFAEACDRFARSYELDPAEGTEVNFADCQEHLGHISRAWQLFDDTAVRATANKNAVRAQYARDRASALLPRLATIVVKVADRRLDRIRITIGGRDVAPAAEIREHFDPGEVEIVAATPERRFVVTVHAEAKQTVTADVPALGFQADHRRRKWMIGAALSGGAGILGVTIAGVLGVSASRRYNDAFARGECFNTPRGDECTPAGLATVDEAHGRANLGTAFFVGGVALLGGGVALYVLAPHEQIEIAPVVAPGAAGVAVSGRF